MGQLQFDSGIREYTVNGQGVLRFHPTDPNLYSRFLEAVEKMQEIEQTLSQQAQALSDANDTKAVLELLAQADTQVKQLLNWVFGQGNDFDQLLSGVNLFAVAGNGQRVITNLFAALEPVLSQGADQCAEALAAV